MMTIIVEPPFELKTEGKTLRMEQAGLLVKRIPFYQIDCLMIRGKVALCADVLRQSAAHAVPVLITASRAGSDAAWVTAGQQPSVMLRIAQHRVLADPAHTLSVIRKVLQAKCNGYRLALQGYCHLFDQRAICKEFVRILEKADRQIPEAETADSMRGIEGFLARQWFHLLAQHLDQHWQFSGRNRRPPKDPVNALISLTHTLIQADVRSALQLRGFDSDIGFLHTPTPARASLVLDLLEPLRPLAECMVVELCQKHLQPSCFDLRKDISCRLNKDGRPIYFAALTRWRQDFASHSQLPDSSELWPDTPVPEAMESLTDVCRHLAQRLANELLNISHTDEGELPVSFTDAED